MSNSTEQEEREYLEEIKERLLLAIRRVDDDVKQFSNELRQNKEYIYEHQSGMDEADMVSAGQSINRMAFSGESAVARKRKLLKLVGSPYFGRIDFVTGIKVPIISYSLLPSFEPPVANPFDKSCKTFFRICNKIMPEIKNIRCKKILFA